MKRILSVLSVLILTGLFHVAQAQIPAAVRVGGTLVNTDASTGAGAGAAGLRSWVIMGHSDSTTAGQRTLWNAARPGNTTGWSGPETPVSYTFNPIASTTTLRLYSTIAKHAVNPQQIQVTGLDANWNFVQSTTTFNVKANSKTVPQGIVGANNVTTGTWRRVFDAQVVGTNKNIGTTYIFTTGTIPTGSTLPQYPQNIFARVTATDLTSENGFWTVPAGSAAVIQYINITGASVSKWQILAKPQGGVWVPVAEGATQGQVDLKGMLPLAAKTDVRVDATATSGDVYCNMGILEYRQ